MSFNKTISIFLIMIMTVMVLAGCGDQKSAPTATVAPTAAEPTAVPEEPTAEVQTVENTPELSNTKASAETNGETQEEPTAVAETVETENTPADSSVEEKTEETAADADDNTAEEPAEKTAVDEAKTEEADAELPAAETEPADGSNTTADITEEPAEGTQENTSVSEENTESAEDSTATEETVAAEDTEGDVNAEQFAASVDGEGIPAETFVQAATFIRYQYLNMYAQYAQMYSMYGLPLDSLNEQMVGILGENGKERLGSEVIDQITYDKVLEMEAKEAGLEITEADTYAQLKTMFGYEDPAPEEEGLANMDSFNVNLEATASEDDKNDEFRQFAEAVLESSYGGKVSFDYLKNYAKNVLTDNKLFAKELENRVFEAEMVSARHILVEDEETAKEIIEKLKDGEDWAALASEHSLDTANKDNSGDLGWFGRGEMVAEFEEAAFALEPGQISEPVKTNFGYHIIASDGKEVRPLSGSALQNAQNAAYDEWSLALRAKHEIKSNQDVWMDIIPMEPTFNPPAPAATEESTVEDAVDEAIEEAVAEDAVEEAVTDAAVEDAVEEAAVEEAVTDAAVEEAVTDAAVEDAVAEAAVEEAVTDVAVEEAVTEAAVEDAVTNAVVEEAVTDAAVEEAVTEAAVEDAVTDAVVEEAVTDAVVEEAVTDAVVEDAVTEAVIEEAVTEAVVDDAVTEAVVEDAVTETVVEEAATEAVVEDAVTETVVEEAVIDAAVKDAVVEAVVEDAVTEAAVEEAASETPDAKSAGESTETTAATEETVTETVVEETPASENAAATEVPAEESAQKHHENAVAVIDDKIEISKDEFTAMATYTRYGILSEYKQNAQYYAMFGLPLDDMNAFYENLLSEQGKAELGNSVIDQIAYYKMLDSEAEEMGIHLSEKEITAQMKQAFGYEDPAAEAESSLGMDSFNLTADEGFADDNDADFRAEVEMNLDLAFDGKISYDFFKDLFGHSMLESTIFDKVLEDRVFEEEQVNARHILVEEEETAKEILTMLESGEDWDELAAEYSLDTGNKDYGGALGWFGRDIMVKEFEDAAFALEPGQISEPVKTSFGWHIIASDGKEIRPMEDEALQAAQNEVHEKWSQDLMAKHQVVSYPDVWMDLIPAEPAFEPVVSNPESAADIPTFHIIDSEETAEGDTDETTAEELQDETNGDEEPLTINNTEQEDALTITSTEQEEVAFTINNDAEMNRDQNENAEPEQTAAAEENHSEEENADSFSLSNETENK